MTVIVKTKSPADLLATMPHLVGFAPHESVVLIAFRDKRTCGAMRFDLPTSASPTVQKRVATHLVGILCKLRGVDGVVPVVCTSAAFGGAATPPFAAFARVLMRRLRQSGFEVRNALCQASDGWASYCDEDSPVGGHPLSDIAESHAVDSMPSSVGADPREQPERVPDADEATRVRVARSLAEYREAQVRLGALTERDLDGDRPNFIPPEMDLLLDLPMLMEDALDWDDETVTARDALLLAAWSSPPVRDMTMLQWASELGVGDLVEREHVRKNQGEPVDPAAAQLMGDLMFGIGPRPDPARIQRGIDLLLTVVPRAEDAARLGPLCMLAWLNWALGHGSAAGRYLDEAIAIRPDYGMAEVIGAMLQRGMLPEWAFARTGDDADVSVQLHTRCI